MEPVSSTSSLPQAAEKTGATTGSPNVQAPADQQSREKVARTFQEIQSSSDATAEPQQKRYKPVTEGAQSKSRDVFQKKDDWLMEEKGYFTYFHGDSVKEFLERVPSKDAKSSTEQWLLANRQSCEKLFLYIKSTIPEEIKKMPSLRTLIIMGKNTGESLPVIPEWLFTLPLTELTIVGCQLSTLSSGIGNLKSLKLLNVADNHLTIIPAEIAQLPHLQQANFTHNPIKQELVPKVLRPLIKSGKILLVSKERHIYLYGPWK